jgi:glycosyltransferase involved in cell wall biosynthesis
MGENMTPDIPLVSIGMPVFNSAKTLHRSLESLLAQDYPNLEIIISDNCSTDETAQICKTYSQKDNRIKLNINAINQGLTKNFEIVAQKASGQYFFWAAGDDYWEPEFTATLVQELEANPNAGVALCAIGRQYPDGKQRDIIRLDSNNVSNIRIAAKLLSPRERIKDQKYNLFICGLFRHEAIRSVLSRGDGIISYGERAFLSPIALGYKFRFVDKVLFVKTVYEANFKQRNPDDLYVQHKKKIKYWKYYSRILVCIAKSPNIPWMRKLFVFVILYYIYYKLTYKLKKKLPFK